MLDIAPCPTEENTLLDALNVAQRKAVESIDGPVLVLAGAGTGKTRVLTTRIVHILRQKKAWPSEILAVTFTNKAAREMQERIGALLSPAPQGEGEGRAANGSHLKWMGTFHSIGVKILRRHADLLGFSSNFTILNDDDQTRLIKTLMAEKNIDEKALPAKLVKSMIQGFKDRGLMPDQVTHPKDTQKMDGLAADFYATYQARMKRLNTFDFGDLLLYPLVLFSEHQVVLEEYSRRFKYILVDEYQDTNVAQYLWLRLLSLGHGNICCVGDDDQSIYSWRGAEVGNILKFEKDFPGAEVVRLECNYRSTGHILATASAVIAHNSGRFGKELFTEGDAGEKVHVKSVWDDGEEAVFVGEEIEALQRSGHSLDEMAILVRAGFQTRSFEERFLSMGIPYRVIGGLRFYERAEIRDAVAYLRVVASNSDDLAFERIINTPKRGIGQATLQKLHSRAREEQISLFAAVQNMLAGGQIKGKLGAALGTLTGQFVSWSEHSSTLPLAELTERILDQSGYLEMWKQEKTPEAAGRRENLRELVRALGEFESLADFLEHVSLVMDNESNSTDAMVSLMTLHAAKGLEFDAIFLPGWEEGLFPHQRAIDESGSKGLEEERRLAYVGITRARKRLFISHAANRRIYNQWQSSIPSRFISELPADHIEQLSGGPQNRSSGSLQDKAAAILRDSRGSSGFKAQPMAASASSGAEFNRGKRVFHQKFGYGKVTEANGNHLNINFEKAGQKKVLADFIELA